LPWSLVIDLIIVDVPCPILAAVVGVMGGRPITSSDQLMTSTS
jgi:hypothetical protein